MLGRGIFELANASPFDKNWVSVMAAWLRLLTEQAIYVSRLRTLKFRHSRT
jgi:hypothetical protein